MLSIQETRKDKKNKGGRPFVGATSIMVRLPPQTLESLDKKRGETSRQDFIRALIEGEKP